MERMRRKLLVVCLLTLCACKPANMEEKRPLAVEPLRYVPIGDSYTVGTGVAPQEAWPMLVADLLRKEGVQVTVPANPARNGRTTKNAIDMQLPVLKAEHANVSTLMIGANDLVQGVDADTFRAQVATLMDAMLEALPSKNRLLVLTIPDFSITKGGGGFATDEQIAERNSIIRDEAEDRGLRVVDLLKTSQLMKDDPTLVAADGLHPSAKLHKQWAAMVVSAFEETLAKS